MSEPASSHSSTTETSGPLELAQVERWFDQHGWHIFPYQQQVWQNYHAGKSGLIHSPTGTGKTLAAWFAALLEHAHVGDCAKPAAVTVLWITPLRALAVDTQRNLQVAVDELGIAWSVGLRTGDTKSAERVRQRKRLPSTLITTPESLSLLLSYANTAQQLGQVKAVIVDEWHELMGSKRGVQLQLCLARLRAMTPALRVWGLSATIGNLGEAAKVLLGEEKGSRASMVDGRLPKEVKIRGLIPAEVGRFPWAGHIGLSVLPEVIATIEAATSTLLFTNTRAQAERWFEALLGKRLDWVGKIALHHGSLDPALRRKVEDLLRRGELLCVVATSSLDLGVDFSPVERVIQVGSPKGVARLLQRAGRSGHRPGVVSEVYCAPTHALELVEIAAARSAAMAGHIEARRPPTLCLDVLCQHLVTLALAGGVEPDSVLAEARTTHAFRELSATAWQWVVDFLVRGGPALKAYPEYQRLVWEEGILKPANRRVVQRHRMAIGTISSDASMRVQFQKGGYLGTVEESFISRLRPGDAFLFSGRVLELVRVRDMTAQVRLANAKRVAVPRWVGGRLPLSTELTTAVLAQFASFRAGDNTAPEIEAAAPLLALQASWSRLPTQDELLIERAHSRDGISLFFYPFAGRLVHEGLAALLAWRLSREQPLTFSIAVNDYGFELLSREEVAFTEQTFKPLLHANNLIDDVLQAINATEMSRRQFRDIARVAGLVFQGYPGAHKTARQVQASSGLIYDVLLNYDPDNQLVAQAQREVLEAQFEIGRMRTALLHMAQQMLYLCDTPRLTPLAFPLWADRLRARLSSETWQQRVEKMQQSLEKAVEKEHRKTDAKR